MSESLSNGLGGLLAAQRRDPNLNGKHFVLGVGAMKAGTSWLNKYLDGIPGVVCSPLKEVHFFDTKFNVHAKVHNQRAVRRVLEHINRDDKFVHRMKNRPHFQASIDRLRMIYHDQAYFEHFSRLSRPDTRVFCEITPAYAILPRKGFKHIREVFAEEGLSLKLVFLLRDPIERHWSHLRFSQTRNSNFDAVGRFHEHLENPTILERSNYRKTIENLTKCFPDDQLYFEFYERLFSEEAMRRFCKFLDIIYRDVDFEQKKNETSIQDRLDEDKQVALFSKLRDVYEFCSDYFGERLPQEWRQNMSRFQ